MITRGAVAGLALALSISSTFAADLPSLKAPIVAPPPAFSWTGLYGGVNIGYGFGSGDQDPGWMQYQTFVIPCPCTFDLPAPAWSISNDPHGVLGGGQAGYNFQFNPWLVIGLEADVQATDVHSQGNGSNAAPAAPPSQGQGGPVFLGPNFAYASQNKSVDWFGTVRGRIGVTFPNLPNLLLYATGGLAYGGVVHSANVSDFFPATPPTPAAVGGGGTNYDQTKVGWTAGGGVEWFPLPAHPLWSAFSVKLEYLYTDLGSTTLNGTSIFTVDEGGPSFFYRQTSQTRWHTARAGVNWHFNPFAPGPVLAKY
jgi:opacity protein-like surface antigen